ncbi:MAG: cytochrome c biogenesis protein CcdA [Planctomycetota bacterium]
MNRLRIALLSLAWLTAMTASLWAQFPPDLENASPRVDEEALTIEGASFEPATVAVGGRATLVIRVKMAPTWHVYSVKAQGDYKPTAINIETKGLKVDGEISEPEPHHEELAGQKLSYHENSFEFRVPIIFDPSVKGELRVKGNLFYVACDPNACNPPKSTNFRAKINIQAAAESAGSDGDATSQAGVELKGRNDFLVGVARLIPANPKPGSEATLELALEVKKGRWTYSFIDPGTYAAKSVISLDKKSMGADHAAVLELVGAPVEPKPKMKEANYGEIVKNYIHKGKVVIRQRIRIAADATPGIKRTMWTLDYQTCDEAGCLPDLIKFRLPIEVADANASSTSGGPALGGAGLKRVLDSVEGLHSRLDGLEDKLDVLTPKAPEAAAIAPSLDFGDTAISLKSSDIRASETLILVYKFRSPEKVHIGSPNDIFVDWVRDDGDTSKRVADVLATEVSSSDDGLSHQITLELLATDAAKSGDETLELSVSAPLVLENGQEFDYELPVARARLSYGIPNLWDWVLKAAFAAFLALLTPCVFPMIPVTVSFFTKQAEQGHKNPIIMPTVYVLGIIASFVAIGVAFTWLFGAAGAQILATNGYVQGLFGVLFILFSLSLFGVFTLQPPAFLMAKAGKVQGRGGLVGTLGMGLLFSLTSFTCTAPLVGLILVAAAESEEWIMPVIGMLSFSTVLAFPFFFLALFPRFLKAMPKSGGWMNSVKVTLGFLELAFALKFLGAMDAYFEWEIFTRTSILWMWVIMFIMNGLYLLGVVRFAHDPKVERVGPISGAIAIILIVFGVYLIAGAKGEQMPFLVESLMPPAFEEVSGEAGLGWAGHAAYRDNPELAYETAKELGVPVFIDYTGVT